MCGRYSEGIDLLYSSNEFRFDNALTLRLFPDLILPQRLARITSVVFNWPLPYELQPHISPDQKNGYRAAWATLADRFLSLRTLRVVLLAPGIADCSDTPAGEFKRAWLEPLDNLTNLKLETFDILVPRSYYHYFKGVGSEKPYRFIGTAHQHEAVSYVIEY